MMATTRLTISTLSSSTKHMKTRYITVAALALSLGAMAIDYRTQHVSQFRQYYASLHEADPDLNALQRVLVSLVLTTSN